MKAAAALGASPSPGFWYLVQDFGALGVLNEAAVSSRLGKPGGMRQMVLGPAREFCLRAAGPGSPLADLGALVIPLRPTWPLGSPR